jgi:hypothetical protein
MIHLLWAEPLNRTAQILSEAQLWSGEPRFCRLTHLCGLPKVCAKLVHDSERTFGHERSRPAALPLSCSTQHVNQGKYPYYTALIE